MIKECKCKHPAQDALHGKQQRVFNPFPKGGKKRSGFPEGGHACTVCGRMTA